MKRLFLLFFIFLFITEQKCTGTDLRLLANVMLAAGCGGFAEEMGKELFKKGDLVPQIAKWGTIAGFGPIVSAAHVINDVGWVLSEKSAQELKVNDKKIVVHALYCAYLFLAWHMLIKADKKFGIPKTWKELYHRLT